jgi:hypothetical protein
LNGILFSKERKQGKGERETEKHLQLCVFDLLMIHADPGQIYLLVISGQVTKRPNCFANLNPSPFTFHQKDKFLEVKPFALFSIILTCLCSVQYMHFLNSPLRFLLHSNGGIFISVSKDSIKDHLKFEEMLIRIWGNKYYFIKSRHNESVIIWSLTVPDNIISANYNN